MASKPIGKLSDPKEQQAREELTYEWIAKYKDGSKLKQYDDTKGLVYHFGHIDQEQVYEFILERRRKPKHTISVNLKTGLFSIDGKPVKEIKEKKTRIPLGLFLSGKKIVSPWGNKAKLIFIRHVRRDFKLGLGVMDVSMTYEIGWEAKVDGKHQKHTLILDDKGRVLLPPTPEQEGFEAL